MIKTIKLCFKIFKLHHKIGLSFELDWDKKNLLKLCPPKSYTGEELFLPKTQNKETIQFLKNEILLESITENMEKFSTIIENKVKHRSTHEC